ncbi:hypothetical protein PR003_g31373 [Phytophthora rubi]|uniref:Uncharacterized protein n=1 Tax=Phytophthora rubi TaxID=129364 RepID=A0A6A4B978_9STRA|nr:hypothetical protein PR002_g20828 [Phytophthora rubi]KAE9268654.1 hypothetical protein PR003_g31373 [Phytophthora rubi]
MKMRPQTHRGAAGRWCSTSASDHDTERNSIFDAAMEKSYHQ